MALIALEIPPGVKRGGTDMQSSGRWRDASLVRWEEGIMQPVGGWQQRAEIDLAGIPRAAIAWQDNSGDRWLSFGSHDTLWAITESGVVHDITPAGFTAGNASAQVNTGFGGGFFGLGFYGTARADTGNYSEATTWSLDNWGEYLVGCTPDDGTLYEWQLDTGTAAAAISNAPTNCLSLVTTPERFLFALGAGGDPRKVQWCDREDNTTWTPAATNEAGDIILETNSQIMAGVKVRGQTLVLTETDAHAASYVGPPFVYGFERVGVSCGLVARKALVAVEGGAMWMGARGFFSYSGGAVDDVPCEVSDYVFSDINPAQQSKIFGVANAMFNEVWWFYPSSASNECDRYVAYNYRGGFWMIGTLDRTCGVDRGVFRKPIWATAGGVVYDQETGFNTGGPSVFAESGPIYAGKGEQVISATMLIPDEATQGDVTATFKTRFYPNGDEYEYGPYTMDTPTDVRFSGRQFRMRITGDGFKDFRWGIPRIEVQGRGKR